MGRDERVAHTGALALHGHNLCKKSAVKAFYPAKNEVS